MGGMGARQRLQQVLEHVTSAGAVVPADDAEIVAAGEAAALSAPNRGPLLVGGQLNPAIVPLFEEWGFFVLE